MTTATDEFYTAVHGAAVAGVLEDGDSEVKLLWKATRLAWLALGNDPATLDQMRDEIARAAAARPETMTRDD